MVAATACVLGLTCSNPTATPRCIAEKTAAYKKYIAPESTELPQAWLEGNVWRVNPVTTVYFGDDCGVTVVGPQLTKVTVGN